jgi:hypothetical protein
MTIVRAPREDRYTILDRSTVNDDRLSFRALGLLTYILDKPDDWRITGAELARGESREGRDAVLTALRELETAGYLRRERIRKPDGTFNTISTVYSQPVDVATDTGEPEPGFPAPVSPASYTSTEPNTETTETSSRGDAAADDAPTMSKAQRDDLYQSIVSACGMEYGEMTKRQQRSCAVAMAELAAVQATPDEVHRRSLIYRQKFECALTPNALANQWAGLREPDTPMARAGGGVMDRVKARLAAEKSETPDNVVTLRAVGQ